MPALIDAARQGDRDAINRLLAASQPDMRRYARRTCRQPSDVDDAVQDALLLVARRVGTLRVVTAFSGWLMVVVRNECLRLARRSLGIAMSLEAINADARFATQSTEDMRLDLGNALHSLPDHYRRVVLLRDVEEYTIAEIAAVEGLTREAVKARLHRARVLLREFLKD